MKPPPFEYVRPVDLDGVLGALAQNSGETKILAGGQSLVPMMNLRLVAPKRLVDSKSSLRRGYAGSAEEN